MIIVEGPDNSGKSHLIQAIQAEFGSKVELSTHSKLQGADRDRLVEGVRERVYDSLALGCRSTYPTLLHDRLFFSELVYGPVLRNGSCFSWEEERHICRVLTAISPPIIFALPPIEVCLNNLDRHELQGVKENAERIHQAYESLSHLARPRITRYDYTRGPAAKTRVMSVVRRYLERKERRTWSPTYTTASPSSPQPSPLTAG